MKTCEYLLTKDKKIKKTNDFTNELNGYNMIQNKKNKIVNGIEINKLVIVNDNFIDKVINKKIEKKFKKLLEFIASIYESDDDSSNGLMMALNEVEKVKREIINKYISYLDKKQIQKLDKKIKLIEQDVQSRMYQYHEYYEEKQVEDEKTSHRRR